MRIFNSNGRIPKSIILITSVIIPIIALTTIVTHIATAQIKPTPEDSQPNKNQIFESTLDANLANTTASTTQSPTIYLPFISNPFLISINNAGEGNFQPSWGNIGAGSTYTLVEDTEPTLSAPHYYPPTSSLSIPVTGKVAGTYYYQVQGRTAGGKVLLSNIETAVVTKLTVADFDKGTGDAVEWYGPCKLSAPGGYDAANAYKGNYGYRLTYGVSDKCYATWQLDLENKDYGGFSEVTFWVKGAIGSETFNVYLQNVATKRGHVEVKQTTTGWQQIRIPLSQFSSQGVDLKHVGYFQIVFEWKNMSGTIYIDEIRFE